MIFTFPQFSNYLISFDGCVPKTGGLSWSMAYEYQIVIHPEDFAKANRLA
ncbi:hypothetical protein LJC37_02430 [Bacteroidales bacterium OttesenSCG-928-E04]|nr:hypothetical protein [Bacteroidales bacterium OttesenSCG-928-E04]